MESAPAFWFALVTASRREQLLKPGHAWPTGVSVVSSTLQAAALALAGKAASNAIPAMSPAAILRTAGMLAGHQAADIRSRPQIR
jgi:hypothetical protein